MAETKQAVQRSPLYRWGGVNAVIDNGWLVASAPLLMRHHSDGGLAFNVTDESARARVGFAGHGVSDWLRRTTMPLPESPNRSVAHANVMIGRLGEEDYLLISTAPSGDTRIGQIIKSFESQAGETAATIALTPFQSSHVSLRLGGNKLSDILAKVCCVDCSPERFHEDEILQTMVANCPVIMVRRQPDLMLLCDQTLAVSLLDTLNSVCD